MVFVIESNIIWYHVHEDRKKKKLQDIKEKKKPSWMFSLHLFLAGQRRGKDPGCL